MLYIGQVWTIHPQTRRWESLQVSEAAYEVALQAKLRSVRLTVSTLKTITLRAEKLQLWALHKAAWLTVQTCKYPYAFVGRLQSAFSTQACCMTQLVRHACVKNADSPTLTFVLIVSTTCVRGRSLSRRSSKTATVLHLGIAAPQFARRCLHVIQLRLFLHPPGFLQPALILLEIQQMVMQRLEVDARRCLVLQRLNVACSRSAWKRCELSLQSM